jgi:hypothetical protein
MAMRSLWLRLIDDMVEPILVREWNPNEFHRRVLELETKGYVARRETYQITPEINPETAEIIHLYTIEMSVSLKEG